MVSVIGFFMQLSVYGDDKSVRVISRNGVLVVLGDLNADRVAIGCGYVVDRVYL